VDNVEFQASVGTICVTITTAGFHPFGRKILCSRAFKTAAVGLDEARHALYRSQLKYLIGRL
jgi:hypothetical protein